MNDKDNIKELFQKELGNYKAKVNPNLWTGIQSSIGGASTAGSVSSIGLVGKTIIGASIVAAVTIGTIVLVKNNESSINKKEKLEISKHNNAEFKENRITNKESDIQEDKEELKMHKNKGHQLNTTPTSNIEDLKNNKLNTEVNNDENVTHTVPVVPKNEKATTLNYDNQNNRKENINVHLNKTLPQSKLEDDKTKIKSDLSQVEIEIIRQNNQFVHFSAKDVPEGASIEWSFGDGNYSYALQPEHFFNNAGNYNVELTIRKGNIETTKSAGVSINIKGEIGQLPNVFTPNGDGQNDIFFIESKHLKSFQLTIMDMNQNVVYTTNNPHFRWNGFDKYDQPVKEGNYIYIIVAEDEAGNTINKYQKLTIQR